MERWWSVKVWPVCSWKQYGSYNILQRYRVCVWLDVPRCQNWSIECSFNCSFDRSVGWWVLTSVSKQECRPYIGLDVDYCHSFSVTVLSIANKATRQTGRRWQTQFQWQTENSRLTQFSNWVSRPFLSVFCVCHVGQEGVKKKLGTPLHGDDTTV